MRSRLPIVLSVTALVVAVLGATPVGEAAMSLAVPRNSVGTIQLRNSAVTSVKVKNGTLLRTDFKAGQIPTGPPGPQGPAGPPGASALQPVFTTGAVNSTATKTQTASCPSGKVALGGGASVVPANAAGVAVSASYLANATTWTASAREITSNANNWSLNVVVVCAVVAQ